MRYIHRLYIFYITIILLTVYLKPTTMFHPDGSLKDFGLGKNRTIFPLWMFSILLVIFVYFGYILLLNLIHRI